MFKRILVPLDESERAERALPVAAKLARASGAVLLLVEVVQSTAEFESGLVAPTTWAPANFPPDRRQAAQYLARVAARDDLAGIKITSGVYAGPVASMLLLVAQSQNADLIVMTTRGRTGLARWALGSVADKVVHHTTVPALLVRDHGSLPVVSQPAADRPLRVLVPLDGSPLAEGAIAPAARIVAALAAPGPAAMHLVRVLDVIDVALAPREGSARESKRRDPADRALSAAGDYMNQLAAELHTGPLAALGLDVTWSLVFDDASGRYVSDIAQAILRAAEMGEPVEGATAPSHCDLIAMATHGRGGLSRWAMGSVAERVLHATTLPLLIVTPRVRPEAPERAKGDKVESRVGR
jgi:nucleotide-binding universal stress UspA family protein